MSPSCRTTNALLVSSACAIKAITGSCRLCYEGSRATLGWVQTQDPFYVCKHGKSDILPGTCAKHGYAALAMTPDQDPLLPLQVTIWRQDADALATKSEKQ